MQDARHVSDKPVLVVDLDGTLVRSDLLFESLWSALSSNPLAAFAALRGGIGVAQRARLKQELALKGPVDVTRLPYNPDVLTEIAQWRAAGGRVALVTASDRMQLVGAVERPGHPWVGQDLGVAMGGSPLGVEVTDDPLKAIAPAQAITSPLAEARKISPDSTSSGQVVAICFSPS